MTDPDVVAELDAWQAYHVVPGSTYAQIKSTLMRARDEIVRLRMERTWTHDADGKMKPVAQVRAEALQEAARLHENIDVACDHERTHGAPGAGAMGAVIEYRDAIRALASGGEASAHE